MPIQTIPDAPSLNYVMDMIYDALGGLSRTVEVKGLDLATIIARKVIPVYSKYFPQEEIVELKPENKVPGRDGFFYVKTKNPILSANRLIGLTDTRSSIANANTAGFSAKALTAVDNVQSQYSVTGSASLSETLITQYNLNNFNAAAILPITLRFNPPNILELFPKENMFGACAVMFTMHPVTLETIGWNMIDEFIEYAKCEYFLSIKSIFKKYEKIASIYGEINLNMEEFEEAKSKKNDILANWRKMSPFRANNRRWIIA